MIFVPSFHLGRSPLRPFGYVSGTRAREGRFALSRGRESRVTVCRLYGNLTGVWFSKRAEDFAPGERSFDVYGGARDVQRGL